MAQKMNNKILEFWDWFKINQTNLSSDIITNKMIKQINDKILSLADLNWEIREGIEKPNMLIISSGGDSSLFFITKKIIELSPSLKDWEFCFHKPPKKWNYFLFLENNGKFENEIYTGDWEYVLLRQNDEFFGLVVKVNNIDQYNLEEQYNIVDIVLENILGDDLSYSLINNVEIVNQFESNQIERKNNIKYMYDHILKIIEN